MSSDGGGWDNEGAWDCPRCGAANGPDEPCERCGGEPALSVDLRGLETAWSSTLEEHPRCAICAGRIGAEEHAEGCPAGPAPPDYEWGDPEDCTCGAEDVPLLLFRGEGMESLALHFACAHRRMRLP